MIQINLLPLEFRQEALAGGRFWSEQRKIVKFSAILLAALTVLFYFQYQWSLRTLKKLEGRWPALQQEVQRVGRIRSEMIAGVKAEKEYLQQSVVSSWRATSVLSFVSEFLPESIWLIELKISRAEKGNTLLLKGLALPSRTGSSIQEIESYLLALKERFPRGSTAMLTTSRQQKDHRELTLFTVVFKWP